MIARFLGIHGRPGAILPVLILSGLLYFVGLGAKPLCNPDEGLYGELPREMLETSNFVTLQCNYASYPDKPPLIPWLGAALYRVAGCSNFTARFWAAAAGLAGVCAVFLLGRALFGTRTGTLAALIYATSAGTVVFSRFMVLDQPISTLLSLTLLGIWKMNAAEEPHKRRAWALAAGAFAGLAVLTKGLQGAVLPGGILLTAALIDPRFRARVRWSAVAWAFGAFLLVALPWHLVAAVKDPQSLCILLFNEQLARFLDHREPVDYETLPVPTFLAIFLAWGLPWSLSLGLSPGRPEAKPVEGSLDRFGTVASPLRFVLAWIVVVLGFFTASQCRLPPYTLPALPALALLSAAGWAKALSGGSRQADGQVLQGPGLLALLGAGLLLGLRCYQDVITDYMDSAGMIQLGFVVSSAVLALGGAGFVLARRRGAPWAFLSLAAAALLFSIAMTLGLGVYQERESIFPLAAALRAHHVGPEATVVLEHPQEYESIGGLSFYLGRRVLVLEEPGRPTSPYPHGPSERFFLNSEEFRALWRSGAPVYFVSDPVSAVPDGFFVGEGFREMSRLRGRRLLTNVQNRESSHEARAKTGAP